MKVKQALEIAKKRRKFD